MRKFARTYIKSKAIHGTDTDFKNMNPQFQEYFVETMEKLGNPGLLLVSTNHQGRSNVMTIGWGLIGTFSEKPVFMVSVKASSYTHELIEDSGEFTINVPEEDMNDIVKHCGRVSGREHDKFSECKLSLFKARIVRAPIIAQCKLHYECRVVHKIDVIPRLVPVKYFIRVIIAKVKEIFRLRNNYRSLYFGEILAVY